MTDLFDDLASTLRTTRKNALARALRMGLTPVCGRCGGTGNYSYNQIDGSRCYGCNGLRYLAPKEQDLPQVLDAARKAVEDGALDAYLARLEDARVAKTATDTMMKAWSGSRVATVNSAISHMARDEEYPGLAELRAANRRMYDAYDAVHKATMRKIDVTEIAALVRSGLAIIAAAEYEPPADLVATAERLKAERDAAHRKRFGF